MLVGIKVKYYLTYLIHNTGKNFVAKMQIDKLIPFINVDADTKKTPVQLLCDDGYDDLMIANYFLIKFQTYFDTSEMNLGLCELPLNCIY